LPAHRSGGHPACRRAEASCPADHAHALERSLLVASVAPGGKMHALYGRQDARRYRQLRDALKSHMMASNLNRLDHSRILCKTSENSSAC